MGIGDKFRDKAQQLEDEAKEMLGKRPKKDEAQRKAAQAQQQGEEKLDELRDDIEGQK
ncbi:MULTISPECIES: hypothetical protein [Kitasatospora]